MELRVTKVHNIFANGKHNGFPGIIKFKEWVYVCCRTGTNHLEYDGKITVIRSKDLDTWEEVAILSCEDDLRDPTFAVLKNRLFLYAVIRFKNNTFKSIAYESSDGIEFSEKKINNFPENYFLWDVVLFKDVLYATAYDTSSVKTYQGGFFRSDDGLTFTKLCNAPVPASEISIDFAKDGTMYALLRNDNNGSIPYLTKSNPPYADFFSCEALPIKLHGPRIKRLDDSCVIIGRNWDEPGRRNLRTDIHILEDNGALEFVRSLPSGGDTSYPSWLNYGENKALLVYYSAHEYCMDYAIDEKLLDDPAAPEHNCNADIYLAYINYKNH